MRLCTIYSRMALVFALLFCETAGGAEWGFDENIGIDHSDNVPNAIEAADRKSESAATMTLSGVRHQQFGDNTGLGLSLIAESVGYFHYSGLDNIGVGARAQLRHKFGLRADAPWVAFALRALHRDYHYDYRDG